jgi:hypothetical protein
MKMRRRKIKKKIKKPIKILALMRIEINLLDQTHKKMK